MAAMLFIAPLSVMAVDGDNSTSVDTYRPIATGVSFLTVSPDAHNGGMGDVGAATTPNSNSQYWNPSKYAFIDGIGGASVSYVPWLRKIAPDIDLVSASGYYKIKDVQTVAMSFRFFSIGNVLIMKDNTDPGYNIKPYDLALDASYSRILAEGFSMGVAMRFIYSDLTGGQSEDGNYITPGWSIAADVSGYYEKEVSLKTGTGKGSFGFNISNIGKKIDYGDEMSSAFIPCNLRLGGAFLLPFDKYNHMSFNIDINRLMVPLRPVKDEYGEETQEAYSERLTKYYQMDPITGIGRSWCDNPDGFVGELKETNFSLGIEYDYNQMFFARMGYYNESKQLGNRKYMTFGAGFRFNVFSLDVAYVLAVAKNNPLDQTLRFTIGFDMGSKVKHSFRKSDEE